jgi:hypothetical protein
MVMQPAGHSQGAEKKGKRATIAPRDQQNDEE